ncbi:hypothetical protein ONZ45_g112 [Pleurotus djamor]|nr:hypothetical protein ONZ45_g112 [Pleurotus djamor]
MSSSAQGLLTYLALPAEYQPSPQHEPIDFLNKHITQLPPHLLVHFSQFTSPKQRTVIPRIRNRRLKYSESDPPEFRFESARNTWAGLWEGQDHRVLFHNSGEDEKAWVKKEFMHGSTQHVGKLGALLSGYEEERQADHVRALRRQRPRVDEFVPEEDEDDSDDEVNLPPRVEDTETPEQAKTSFLRLLKERFIYGLLDGADYDGVDWNDVWDTDNERDAEEKWFDDEEELTIPFKGTDSTFSAFPERLQHTLSQSIPSSTIECLVFPAYETKGDLNEAVIRFADWLTTKTVETEVASGGGAGSTRIVLCGHSMGGLLVADSLLEFIKTRPDESAPLWPNIVACIALDTPYIGLNPGVFKNSATQAFEYATSARTAVTGLLGAFAGFGKQPPKETQRAVAAIAAPPSTKTPGMNWAPAAYAVGGALLAGAAAGGAYYARNDLGEGYKWFTDHMKYVGNLWDEEAMKKRLAALVDVEEKHRIVFRDFYTSLPSAPPRHLGTRTFILLPPQGSRERSHFIPASNSLALDEIKAHTGMFSGSTNDGYYELGLAVAKIIREAVVSPVQSASTAEKRVEEGSRSEGTKEADDLINLDV